MCGVGIVDWKHIRILCKCLVRSVGYDKERVVVWACVEEGDDYVVRRVLGH